MNKENTKIIYDSLISRVNKTLIQFDNEIIPALAERVKMYPLITGKDRGYLDGYLAALDHVSISLNSLVINLEKPDA